MSKDDVLWEIDRDSLPLTLDICLAAEVDTCGDLKSCHNHCVGYGVRSLAYDKKHEKLYLLADTLQVGQGGGPFLGFVADLKTKKISYLKMFFGFADGYLSPSSKYLLVVGNSYIQIYNTETHQQTDIPSENIWTKDHERLHYIGNIKWLSDTRFSYTVAIKHDKFQRSNDETKKIIYDIPSKKTIESRLIDKASTIRFLNHNLRQWGRVSIQERPPTSVPLADARGSDQLLQWMVVKAFIKLLLTAISAIRKRLVVGAAHVSKRC